MQRYNNKYLFTYTNLCHLTTKDVTCTLGTTGGLNKMTNQESNYYIGTFQTLHMVKQHLIPDYKTNIYVHET